VKNTAPISIPGGIYRRGRRMRLSALPLLHKLTPHSSSQHCYISVNENVSVPSLG